MKKEQKQIILYIAVLLVFIALIFILAFAFRAKPKTKNDVDREKERETVLEIATEEMASSGYSTDNYQLEVERYNSDGTYDVRMLQDGEKTKFYYTVDPDTKETIFNLEVQSNANKEKERLAE